MEDYLPKSDFLALAGSGGVPLAGNKFADENLELLVSFTRDPDKSNRDWATMALGMYGPDTQITRDALIAAADDEDCDVRGEAIEALAERDASIALPLVQRDLSRSPCGYGVFVAAALIADPRLIEPLKKFDRDTDAGWMDELIRDAIRACQLGDPHVQR
jgi:HEAT repeat protein